MYKISYITNVAFLLHVSAIHVVIFREVRYKRWIHRDITKVYDPMHRCKILSFNNTYCNMYLSHVLLKVSIYINNIRYFIRLCAFGGFGTKTNCSVHYHGLFKFVSKLEDTSSDMVLGY